MKKIRNFISFIPAVLWYRLIWNMSAQPAALSSQSSNSLMGNLFSALIPAYSDTAPLFRQAVLELMSFYIRKSAHMFLFFVLSIFMWYAMAHFLRKRHFRALCTALACAALAALDEFHQTFVPGRSGEMRDVMVDFTGVVIAMLMFSLPAIGAWLRKTLSHPEMLWCFGIFFGACLLIYIGIHTDLAPVFTSRVDASPLLASVTAEERSGLLSGAAPILKQLLYLAASAVTAFFSVCLASLSARYNAVLAATAAAICIILVTGILYSMPVVVGVVLGFAISCVATVLWKCFPLLSK